MSGPVTVRFAAPDDLDWCAVCDHTVARPMLDRKQPHRELLVAERGGQRVGYLRLEFLWSKLPYIGLIWIVPEHRRQGVGRHMLRYLEEHLRSAGYDRLLSSSQASETEPQAWHRHVGFADSGRLANCNYGGDDEVFFCKFL